MTSRLHSYNVKRRLVVVTCRESPWPCTNDLPDVTFRTQYVLLISARNNFFPNLKCGLPCKRFSREWKWTTWDFRVNAWTGREGWSLSLLKTGERNRSPDAERDLYLAWSQLPVHTVKTNIKTRCLVYFLHSCPEISFVYWLWLMFLQSLPQEPVCLTNDLKLFVRSRWTRDIRKTGRRCGYY